MIEWLKVAALPWRQRNAEVERALREFLADEAGTFATFDLACRLWPQGLQPANASQVTKLAQLLTRLAPYMGPLATHDGETITRYRKRWRRWRWHGAKVDRYTAEDKVRDEIANDGGAGWE